MRKNLLYKIDYNNLKFIQFIYFIGYVYTFKNL